MSPNMQNRKCAQVPAPLLLSMRQHCTVSKLMHQPDPDNCLLHTGHRDLHQRQMNRYLHCTAHKQWQHWLQSHWSMIQHCTVSKLMHQPDPDNCLLHTGHRDLHQRQMNRYVHCTVYKQWLQSHWSMIQHCTLCIDLPLHLCCMPQQHTKCMLKTPL